MALSPGSTLERYEIVRQVGRGGMGEVYHAIDTRLRRPVALKVLREDKDQSAETGIGGVQRLMREARSAAALNHPNSVAIYELGEADGVSYIAMELVTGESFRTHAKSATITLETKIGWLVDAARALWAAHKAGIVHRDIKPSNIMVSEEGVVKILDFGLAKPHVDALSEPGFQTVLGQVLGTPRYMAPEQLEGKSPDARSDQYAFGLTAYELFTGEYAGGPLGGNPMPPSKHHPLIPPQLDQVVTRMLSRSIEARFDTMEEVAHALRAAIPAVRDARARAASAAHEDEATHRGVNVRELAKSGEQAPKQAPTPPHADLRGSTVRLPKSPLSSEPLGDSSSSRRLNRTLPLATPIASIPPQSEAKVSRGAVFGEAAQSPSGPPPTTPSSEPRLPPSSPWGPPSYGLPPSSGAPRSPATASSSFNVDPQIINVAHARSSRKALWIMLTFGVAMVMVALAVGLALAIR